MNVQGLYSQVTQWSPVDVMIASDQSCRPHLQPRPSREAVTDPHLCSTSAQASPSFPLGLGWDGCCRMGCGGGSSLGLSPTGSDTHRLSYCCIRGQEASEEDRLWSPAPSSLTHSLTYSHIHTGLMDSICVLLCMRECVCVCFRVRVASNCFHLSENRRDMKQKKQEFVPEGHKIFLISTLCYVWSCPKIS